MGFAETGVMAVLWAATGPLTPAQVQAELDGGLAYNTVQTVLFRLLDKGLVHRGPSPSGGRGHVYWPSQDAAVGAAQRMRAALNGPGDRRAVLREFAADLDPADAEVLRALLGQSPRDPA